MTKVSLFLPLALSIIRFTRYVNLDHIIVLYSRIDKYLSDTTRSDEFEIHVFESTNKIGLQMRKSSAPTLHISAY